MSLGRWHVHEAAGGSWRLVARQAGVRWTGFCAFIFSDISTQCSDGSTLWGVAWGTRPGGQVRGQTEVQHGRDLTHPPGSPSTPHWAPSPLLLRLRQHRLLRLRHLRLLRRHLLLLWLRQHMYLTMVLDGTGPDAQSRGTSLVEPANLWAGGTSWAVSPGPTPGPLIDTGGSPGHCEVTEPWTSQTPPTQAAGVLIASIYGRVGGPGEGTGWGRSAQGGDLCPQPGHQPRGDKEGPLCKGLSVRPSLSYSVNTKLLHTSLLGARFWARPWHPGTNKADTLLPDQLCNNSRKQE